MKTITNGITNLYMVVEDQSSLMLLFITEDATNVV